MNLIAVTGPQLAGKTTLARELERRGWRFVDFTGRLKELAAISLSEVGPTVTRQMIEQDKAKYRRYLQELATLIGYDDNPVYVQDALYAVGFLLPRADRARFVFDNVRTMEQWNVLKGYGFTLVRLDTNYDLRFRRARNIHGTMTHDEFESQHDHVIEHGGALWDEASVVLDGSRNVVSLADMLIGGSNESAGER